jgi:hypothetical protein
VAFPTYGLAFVETSLKIFLRARAVAPFATVVLRVGDVHGEQHY